MFTRWCSHVAPKNTFLLVFSNELLTPFQVNCTFHHTTTQRTLELASGLFATARKSSPPGALIYLTEFPLLSAHRSFALSPPSYRWLKFVCATTRGASSAPSSPAKMSSPLHLHGVWLPPAGTGSGLHRPSEELATLLETVWSNTRKLFYMVWFSESKPC